VATGKVLDQGHPENCSTCCTVPQSTTVVYAQKLNRQNGIASERLIYVDTHDINIIFNPLSSLSTLVYLKHLAFLLQLRHVR
jgi:hypothetical protein